MHAFGCQSWLWFFDGTYPKNMDGAAGKNLQGFKSGKVKFLWPLAYRGKHAPKGQALKVAEMFARVLKTKPIDSFLMDDAAVAAQIMACFPRSTDTSSS